MQITFSLRNNNLVIDSTQSLDDFSAAFADLTKLKKTHVKSTLSKLLGHNHIKALESVLTPLQDSPLAPFSDKTMKGLQDLYWWLDDNIDMNTEMYFDSHGEVDSKALQDMLSPLFDMMRQQQASGKPIANRVEEITAKRDGILSDMMTHALQHADVDSKAQLEQKHYHAVQYDVEALNRKLFNHDDYGKALAILEREGMQDFANLLAEMTETKAAEDHLAHIL